MIWPSCRPARAGSLSAAVPAATLLAVALAGCGLPQADSAGAEQAARSLHEAVSARNGAAACALLAPGTIEQVEDQAEQPCAEAITEQQIPSAADVLGSDVHGRSARVTLAGDTVFLSRFDQGWRVVAAGCELVAKDRPYDCAVKGD